jgi:hypothetical protein
MNKHHLLIFGAAAVAGYLLATTLANYPVFSQLQSAVSGNSGS